MSPSARRQGLRALLTVIVAWGLTWPVNKVVLAALSPLWAVTLRSVIATGALFALTASRGRLTLPPRQDLSVLLSITLLQMVGFNLLASWGLGLVRTGRTVVLAYTTPLWVTPGAALFLREPLTVRRLIGVLVGLAGLVTGFNPLALDWTDRAVVLGHLAILAEAPEHVPRRWGIQRNSRGRSRIKGRGVEDIKDAGHKRPEMQQAIGRCSEEEHAEWQPRDVLLKPDALVHRN